MCDSIVSIPWNQVTAAPRSTHGESQCTALLPPVVHQFHLPALTNHAEKLVVIQPGFAPTTGVQHTTGSGPSELSKNSRKIAEPKRCGLGCCGCCGEGGGGKHSWKAPMPEVPPSCFRCLQMPSACNSLHLSSALRMASLMRALRRRAPGGMRWRWASKA